MPKKKKKKKIKKSSAFKSLRQLMVEDAGKGLENFNKIYKTNVFYEAYKVKDYKQLERFIERYAPGMTAADVAIAAGKYAKESLSLTPSPPMSREDWTKLNQENRGAVSTILYKNMKFAVEADGKMAGTIRSISSDILKMSYKKDAVFELLDNIDKKKGGAVEVWKLWKNNEFFMRGLAKFAFDTGYKVPKTSKTFQEQVTMFKKYFKLNRKKKKVAQFLDKEFKI